MNSRRIPSLDGLRALAVLLVLLGHVVHTGEFPQWQRSMLFFDAAHFGVSIFFVLSGFLITSLLIEEWNRTGKVSLRDFYIRRTMRIFPAAYLYLVTVGLLVAMGVVELRDRDLVHAVTYTMNYHHDRAWALGHLWSLAVEEQFYLLWPLVFLLCGQRSALWLVAGAIAVVPVLRVTSWIYLPETRVGIDEEFQFVCDGLATGCLLALLIERYGIDRMAMKIPRLLFIGAPVAAIVCCSLAQWTSFALPIGVTITNLAIGLVVLWCVSHADTAVGRVLNCRLAVFLGTISYSLYLWQQLFIGTALSLPDPVFPMNVILSLAAAIASYFIVERPLQGLRQRFRR